MKRAALVLAGSPAGGLIVLAQPHPVERVFADFTAEWIGTNPDQAVSARYLSGDEQQRLERQLTPQTDAYARSRRELARGGVRDRDQALKGGPLTPTEQISAELMRWQLQIYADAEPYSDFNFPFQQFDGVNVNLPNTLVVVHPMLNEQDAENYIARLEQIDDRIDEAIADSRRIAAKGL